MNTQKLNPLDNKENDRRNKDIADEISRGIHTFDNSNDLATKSVQVLYYPNIVTKDNHKYSHKKSTPQALCKAGTLLVAKNISGL